MVDLKDFWENNHRRDDAVYLSGNKGQFVWDHLFVKDMLKSGSVILNIGVGLGYCTQDLHKITQEVYAVDISQKALDRVGSYVRRSWLAENLTQIPHNMFDLVICFLVAQHMSDKDLSLQLKAVVKALKPNGVAAYQFAYLMDGVKLSEENEWLLRAGGRCRYLSDIDILIRESGGEIIFAKHSEYFPQYGSGWYAVHFKKR